jgi:hypothetical protein
MQHKKKLGERKGSLECGLHTWISSSLALMHVELTHSSWLGSSRGHNFYLGSNYSPLDASFKEKNTTIQLQNSINFVQYLSGDDRFLNLKIF